MSNADLAEYSEIKRVVLEARNRKELAAKLAAKRGTAAGDDSKMLADDLKAAEKILDDYLKKKNKGSDIEPINQKPETVEPTVSKPAKGGAK